MAKVMFWSPDKQMAGNTHTALAVATLMGIKYKAKSILMQGHFNSRKMESAFTPYDELLSSGVFENSDMGIGALTKIIVSNKLTPTAIKNYAKPVLKDRLDILYGVISKEKEQYEMMANNLQFIIRKADEIYDLVLMDLPKGNKDKYIQEALIDSDVVVCIVNQDAVKLEEFFNKIEKDKFLKDKPKIFVIGDYDDKSKYNAFNIKKKYRVKEPIFVLPHNFSFADSANEGSIIDFFYKNLNAEKTDYNGMFINETSKIVDKIIELTKIKDY